MPRDDQQPPPAVNPAHEKTVRVAPPAPQAKDTAKSGGETVPDKQPKPAPPLDSTQQQDEKDAHHSALESAHVREGPPALTGYTFQEKLGHGAYGVVWRAT